jgi:hypothetical protein
MLLCGAFSSVGDFSTMDASLTDLAAAIRERLAIIGDEESRTDPDRHTDARSF